MADFKNGDDVSYVYNGKESEGFVRYENPDGSVVVRNHDGMTESTVHRTKLSYPRKPHFNVHGQVMTTSASHNGKVGEIIAIGHGPKHEDRPIRRFYQVQFEGVADPVWFSEDQVFIADIDSEPKSQPATDLRVSFAG